MSSSTSIDIRHGTHFGKPMIIFNAQDYFINITQEYKLTIVRKLYKKKPTIRSLRKKFTSQFDLKGSVKIAYVDPQIVMKLTISIFTSNHTCILETIL